MRMEQSLDVRGHVERPHDAILTTVLICFVTSSIPKFSFEMATEMSSFARGSDVFTGIDLLVCCACGRYSSPARMELAYSFGSKSGFAKIAYSAQTISIERIKPFQLEKLTCQCHGLSNAKSRALHFYFSQKMLAVRARCSTRLLSTTARLRRPDDVPKPPPKPVDDSTSALEYKRTHRHKPPPLPIMDVPRRSAEEAVTNILYNTPPPSLQPFKKHELPSSLTQSLGKTDHCPFRLFPRHILNCLVQNEPGVLSRVSGILAGRGFNIDSLVVCRTEVRDLSRMCIVLSGQDGIVEQARRQLEDLVCRHLSMSPLPPLELF